MTRNVADAAKGSADNSNNIAGVASAAQGTSNNAQESQETADDLAQMADQLRSLVIQLKNFWCYHRPREATFCILSSKEHGHPRRRAVLLGIFIACN